MAGANSSKFDGTNLDPTGTDFLLDVDLSHALRGSQSVELAAHLRSAIRDRSMPAGQRLPPTRSLAATLGVSRGTVVRAYEQLTAEGYVISHQGRGTVVAPVPDAPSAEHLTVVRRPSNPGLPSGASFPRVAWQRCAAKALADLADDAFGYGDPAGFPALRSAVAGYLGRVRAAVANQDRVIITNGFAQASRLVAEVLLRRGVTRIGVEDPGSSGFREQMDYVGLECVPIGVDDEGIDVTALESSGVAAVFVTPAHQFPTGVVMTPGRRRQLLEWARRCDGYIVEDDYDAEFRYDRAPVGSLHGLDPDRVLYAGSVSKTLAPAIRLGWMVVPEEFFVPLVDAKFAAGLGLGVMDQATLSEFLGNGGYERHLRKVASDHRQRRDALIAALGRHLGAWQVLGARAGLHLVVRIGPALGDRSEVAAAEAAAVAAATRGGLDVRPMSMYRMGPLPPNGVEPQLVIGFGHLSPRQLHNAVRATVNEL